MLFSLTTAVYGEYDSQLGNLLAVYLAYGQFILVFNSNIVDSKNFSIADKINFMGILINLVQFGQIIYFG